MLDNFYPSQDVDEVIAKLNKEALMREVLFVMSQQHKSKKFSKTVVLEELLKMRKNLSLKGEMKANWKTMDLEI